jgi:DNA polymerase I-like protein with 3'-5' exonuclease and polymerase domains
VNRPRLRTVYHQHKTDSGRLSSGEDESDREKVGRAQKRVQVQNWPKELRDIVAADPGHVFVGGDWSAIQWALCMWFAEAGDGFHLGLLDKQQAGLLDPHTYLADHFREPQQDPKEARQIAKAYTYGKMFYGADETIGRQSGHPPKLARKVGQAHLKAFRLEGWWERVCQQVARDRFIETPAGFRRYFFESVKWQPDGRMLISPKPTEILATLIQGAEADLLKYCLQGFDLAPEWIEWITTTHDSVVVQAPEDRADPAKEWLTQLMSQPIPFLGDRGWKCDVKVGGDWRSVS